MLSDYTVQYIAIFMAVFAPAKTICTRYSTIYRLLSTNSGLIRYSWQRQCGKVYFILLSVIFVLKPLNILRHCYEEKYFMTSFKFLFKTHHSISCLKVKHKNQRSNSQGMPSLYDVNSLNLSRYFLGLHGRVVFI